MSRVLGVNGILSHGERSIDLLLAELRRLGHETVDVALPLRDAFFSRFEHINRDDARRVLALHRTGDAIVAHSRGALVTWFAMVEGARFGSVFLFAPAMEATWPWPSGAEKIYVVHNPRDPALRIGEWLDFQHPFGALGLTGYAGPPPDARITNVPASYPGHSDYFYGGELARWAGFVNERLSPLPLRLSA